MTSADDIPGFYAPVHRALAEPISYTGALGLRHLDDDTTARILAQIGDPQ